MEEKKSGVVSAELKMHCISGKWICARSSARGWLCICCWETNQGRRGSGLAGCLLWVWLSFVLPVELYITRLDSFSNGILYMLELEQPESSNPYDELLNRKYIGYFYVTDEIIYYLPASEDGYTDENNSRVIEKIQCGGADLPEQCMIVCCENATGNIADDNGYHAYVEVDGDKRIFHFYNDYIYGSKEYMLMVWEKGQGITYYIHGNGAKNMHVEFGRNIKEEQKVDYGYPYTMFHDSL